jgi:hypothetical protein
MRSAAGSSESGERGLDDSTPHIAQGEFLEVCDNAAALDVHRATDHYKKYQAVTKEMVSKRDVKPFMPVAMNMKETRMRIQSPIGAMTPLPGYCPRTQNHA